MLAAIALLVCHAAVPPQAALWRELGELGPGARATVSGDGSLFTCDDPGTAHRVLASTAAMVRGHRPSLPRCTPHLSLPALRQDGAFNVTFTIKASQNNLGLITLGVAEEPFTATSAGTAVAFNGFKAETWHMPDPFDNAAEPEFLDLHVLGDKGHLRGRAVGTTIGFGVAPSGEVSLSVTPPGEAAERWVATDHVLKFPLHAFARLGFKGDAVELTSIVPAHDRDEL